MPIVVYHSNGPRGIQPKEVAWLCGGSWRLPTQVAALKVWLRSNKEKIKRGAYIADIGFSVRADAAGGGSALSIDMMRTMAELGITLFLSEYPAMSAKRKPKALHQNRRPPRQFRSPPKP